MVHVDKEGNVDIVHFLNDRINALNVGTVKKAVLPLLEQQNNRIIIDLEGINYIDSTGFAMFLQLLRTAKINYCALKLCGMSQSIQTLFSTLQLQTTFDLYSDKETCLKSF
jgi:anti-sigma B factor antagonist